MRLRGDRRLRIDLHVHTCYSDDSWVDLEAIVEAVVESPVDAIAVLDHNEIEGAFRLAEMASFPVFIGEEIASREGEIAGLFLNEWIPPGLSMQDTVARIKAQGGLVYVPHPLARDVPSAIGRRNLEAIVGEVDIIEGFNARILWRRDNVAAQDFAHRWGIPLAAGSDAHFAREIGRAGVELDPFDGPAGLVQSLHTARIFGHRTPYLFSLITCGLWYVDKFRGILGRVSPWSTLRKD